MKVEDAIVKKVKAIEVHNNRIDELIAKLAKLRVNQPSCKGLKDKMAKAVAISLEVRRLSNHEIHEIYEWYTVELELFLIESKGNNPFIVQEGHGKGKRWCMCLNLEGVARDTFSTCSICQGIDAYGKAVRRPYDALKQVKR